MGNKYQQKERRQGFHRLRGREGVSKDHLKTQVRGTIDKASSHRGLARASALDEAVKRIILQAEKHPFSLCLIGADVSNTIHGGRQLKREISGEDLDRLDVLFQSCETLNLHPRFVAFGQEESSSCMDVAATGVRKA